MVPNTYTVPEYRRRVLITPVVPKRIRSLPAVGWTSAKTKSRFSELPQPEVVDSSNPLLGSTDVVDPSNAGLFLETNASVLRTKHTSPASTSGSKTPDFRYFFLEQMSNLRWSNSSAERTRRRAYLHARSSAWVPKQFAGPVACEGNPTLRRKRPAPRSKPDF